MGLRLWDRIGSGGVFYTLRFRFIYFRDQSVYSAKLRDQICNFQKCYPRAILDNVENLGEPFEHFEDYFLKIPFPVLLSDTFPNLVLVCRFWLIFCPFVKYPFMHSHKHKNTVSLAF